MLDFKTIASAYAAMGVPVIPVQPRDKACKLPNWQNLATTNPEIIQRWHDDNPEYNVGVVAKLQEDGVLILDCDQKGIIKLIQEETGHTLPATFIVRSGKGMAHIYFRQTEVSRKLGNRDAKRPEGGEMFSLRSDNRYVVGAGSIHPNGKSYEIFMDDPIAPFPEWLVPWIEKYSQSPKTKFTKGGSRSLVEDFDFDDFLNHYEIEAYEQGDGWHVTLTCPYADRQHEQSTHTGFFYDGNSLGFKCFAGGCGDPTVGQVIRKLNDTHKPYPEAIWPKEEFNYFNNDWEADDASDDPDRIATVEEFVAITGATPAKPRLQIAAAAQPVSKANLGAALDDLFAEPTPIDVNAVTVDAHDDPKLTFPVEALYGRVGKLAIATQVPLGFAYPALLAVCCGENIYDTNKFVRGSLYVALIAGVGAGKSVTKDRVLSSVSLPASTIIRTTPGSDRGLIKTLGDVDGAPRVLVQDELRNILSKANIQGSSLPPVLCTLWSEDIAGAADKQKVEECNARVSLLGNLACQDPAEFKEVFGSETTKGLADRFVFGLAPPIDFEPLTMTPQSFEVRPCKVPKWCFDRKKQWMGSDPQERGIKGRVGEIALRIALITSAVNGDDEVTPAAMEAALRFADWQLAIRSVYRSGIAINKDAECEEAVSLALRQRWEAQKAAGKPHDKNAPPSDKVAKDYDYVCWSWVMNQKDYNRRFGSYMLNRLKENMHKAGLIRIVMKQDDDGHETTKATKFVLLSPDLRNAR